LVNAFLETEKDGENTEEDKKGGEGWSFSGFLVWTTSPWSLVASEGVVINPKEKYLLVRNSDKRCLVVSQYIFGTNFSFFRDHWIGEEPSTADSSEFVLGVLTGAEIARFASVGHPLDPVRPLSLILSESVKISTGTGLLHIVPGCCDPDYKLGIERGLRVACPLDANAKINRNFGDFPELRGFSVEEASAWVLEDVKGSERLVATEPVVHGQPHCLDCGTRLYFKICDRWFFDLKVCLGRFDGGEGGGRREEGGGRREEGRREEGNGRSRVEGGRRAAAGTWTVSHLLLVRSSS
jgi:isoleucyl-tRNA synthetase